MKALIQQPHGGALLSGGVEGNRGGSGRPPSAVRLRCLAGFFERIGVAETIADDPAANPRDRLAALDLLAKYGGLQHLAFDPQIAALDEDSNRRMSALLKGCLTP